MAPKDAEGLVELSTFDSVTGSAEDAELGHNGERIGR